MSLLQTLMESKEVDSCVAENKEILEAAEDVLLEFPKALKSYIHEHLEEFIEPNDLDATYENMVTFVEAGTDRFIKEIVSMLRGDFDDYDEV